MQRFAHILIALFLLPASAWAQTPPDNPHPAPDAAWSRIENLDRGQEITISTPGSVPRPCRFAGATGDLLFCHSLFGDREYRYYRTEIERVRRDDKRRNLHILVGSLAAAGFIWGVATPSTGTPRGVAGLEGGAIGAFAGLVVSLPVALLIPGRTLYRHQQAHR